MPTKISTDVKGFTEEPEDSSAVATSSNAAEPILQSPENDSEDSLAGEGNQPTSTPAPDTSAAVQPQVEGELESEEPEGNQSNKSRTAKRIDHFRSQVSQRDEQIARLQAQLSNQMAPPPASAQPAQPENTPEYWAQKFNEEKSRTFESDQRKMDDYYARYESAKEQRIIAKATQAAQQFQSQQVAQQRYSREVIEVNEDGAFLKTTPQGMALDKDSQVYRLAQQKASQLGYNLPSEGLPSNEALYFIQKAQIELLKAGGGKIAAAVNQLKTENQRLKTQTGLETPRRAPMQSSGNNVQKQVADLQARLQQNPRDTQAQQALMELSIQNGGLNRGKR